MSADLRQAALAMLSELAALAPEVRLGQLMAHLGFLGEDQVERSLWDIDDGELLTVLRRHRAELAEGRLDLEEAGEAGNPEVSLR